MKAQIIQIGNSKGIRIPKPILEESNLDGQVELEVVEQGLLIKSVTPPRHGWDSAFKKLAANDEDELLISQGTNTYDEENWRW